MKRKKGTLAYNYPNAHFLSLDFCFVSTERFTYLINESLLLLPLLKIFLPFLNGYELKLVIIATLCIWWLLNTKCYSNKEIISYGAACSTMYTDAPPSLLSFLVLLLDNPCCSRNFRNSSSRWFPPAKDNNSLVWQWPRPLDKKVALYCTNKIKSYGNNNLIIMITFRPEKMKEIKKWLGRELIQQNYKKHGTTKNWKLFKMSFYISAPMVSTSLRVLWELRSKS